MKDDRGSGLVGSLSGSINQSSSSAIVTAGGSSGEAQVGGLVGEMQGGSILNSHATGQVNAGDTADEEAFGAGGLVGTAEDGPTGGLPTIQGSYATGAVSGADGATVGGFIGIAHDTTIATSYATRRRHRDQRSPPASPTEAGGFAGLSSIARRSASRSRAGRSSPTRPVAMRKPEALSARSTGDRSTTPTRSARSPPPTPTRSAASPA